MKTIGSSAFEGCSNLKDVYYCGTEDEWKAIDIGEKNDSLRDAKIHYVSAAGTCGEKLNWMIFDGGTLTISGTGDMDNYSLVESKPAPWAASNGTILEVIIADGVTSIGDFAFAECTALKSVSIPESVTSIGSYAFADCTALTSVTIPKGVTSIQDYTFYKCESLKDMTIPEGVESIGRAAFADCTSLTSATFPASLKKIDTEAFEGCSKLKDIYYEGTPDDWKNVVIEDRTISAKGEPHYMISAASVTGLENMIYTGKELTPAPEVTLGSTKLEAGTDYTVSYTDNINVGTATVTIRGTGTYEGTVAAQFTITPASMEGAKISGLTAKTFTGKATTQKPVVKLAEVTLKEGTDYKVAYSNNINAGTAVVTITGTGNCTGAVSATYKINPASLAKAAISGFTAKTYTGKAITQKPVVKVGGTTLKAGADYKVTYANNINAGTAKVTITGTGNYTGTAGSKFTINKAANPLSIKAKTAKVKLAKVKKKAQKLNASKIITFTANGEGKVTYKLVSAKLGKKSFKRKFKIAKANGKLTVKKGLKKGTYKVKIKVKAAGNANYNASEWKTVTVKIKVK